MFKDILHTSQSIFKDIMVLDYDFQPDRIEYRENEQKEVAKAVAPLIKGYPGKTLFVHGIPGIGKTTAVKQVLRELEAVSDITCLYVNCWDDHSTHKVLAKLCYLLGNPFIQHKPTNELLLTLKNLCKNPIVLVLDEIDKLEDTDILYTLFENIPFKTMVLLTNYRNAYKKIDERVRSRLNTEFLEFRPYTREEVEGILRTRLHFAFQNQSEKILSSVTDTCHAVHDIRVGLYILKEAGLNAESENKLIISESHITHAINKVHEFYVKPVQQLDDDLTMILKLVKDCNGKNIGDVYLAYQQNGGSQSYRSFQRKIAKLADGKFIRTEKGSGRGNTTVLYYAVIEQGV